MEGHSEAEHYFFKERKQMKPAGERGALRGAKDTRRHGISALIVDSSLEGMKGTPRR